MAERGRTQKQIIVAGAGASGMMAAITAARAGAGVTLLEAMERPGRKLLITGNGRCNLTNTDCGLSHRYHGSAAALAAGVTQQFDAADTLAFFEELGLLTTDREGYVYPYSRQAASVLEVLLAELYRLGVKIKLNEKIQEIGICSDGEGAEKEPGKAGSWFVRTGGWTYRADAVILACGSAAAPATGSDGSGYTLARMLGHTVIEPSPALVPVTCRGDFFAALAGVRCRARVSLVCDAASAARGKRLLASDTGELQWTKYGVSGIVIFQISRFISTCTRMEDLTLYLDLLPDFEETRLVRHLLNRACRAKEMRISGLLAGMLHEKLIPVILKRAGLSAKLRAGCLTQEQAGRLIEAVKHFELEVTGTKSFDVCQVCAGGVEASELDPRTLGSRKHEGLYFAGELIDADGPCGGYNLQWAWSSGYVAGMAAALDLRHG